MIAHDRQLGLLELAAARGVDRDAEVREGEYSAVRGFFREYELYYVAADHET